MRGFWRAGSQIAAAATLALATPMAIAPAQAQFSESYNFLKAIRDRSKPDQSNKALELLRKPGSTVANSRDLSTGDTALHIVVRQRDVQWTNFLIMQGANPNLANNAGETPLMVAVQIRSIDMATILLARGAKVDQDNRSGETPLIRAVQLGDIPMVRLLIESGANPDTRDSLAGMSARDYAGQSGRSPMLVEALSKAKPVAKREVQGPSF